MSDQKVCPTCGTEYPLSERFCPRDGTALRSANVSADLLGSVVADRYHILKKLGEGGMGTVYLAEHVKMGRKSALKVMNPGMNTDPDAIARFNREASNASRLSHPNICGIYDFGETPDGLIYLAMEFIEGSSLTSLIEKSGSLPAPRAASIVHQTADALQVAHDAGIVHRDLKPDNIMVTKNRDGSDLVKVVDFGIAKASSSDAQKVTKTGMVVGTPEYMSPEQLAGDKLDGRSDIYSLGLVAFNCLTGALPFAAETAQEAMIMRLTDRPRTLVEVAPGKPWPEALQATLDKALARDAGERYASAAQFGRDFAAAIADMPMTQAVEAKTSVLGAVSAISAADAATKAMPATRVAEGRPSARTAQMEAPAGSKKAATARAAAVDSPAKKSVMPIALGGGGALVAILVVAWQLNLFGVGTLPGPQVTPDPTAKSGDTTNGAQTPTTSDPDTTLPRDTQRLSNQGRPTVRPSDPNANKVPANNPIPGPATFDGSAAIAKWRTALEDSTLTDPEPVARGALRELEPMLPKLSGIQLDDAHYVVLQAYFGLDSDTEICTYGKLVKAGRLGSRPKAAADQMMTGRRCSP